MGQAISHITDSTFVSGLDLHKPQILNTIYKKFGTQGVAYLRVRALGFETPVKLDEYSHFEESLYIDNIKQAAGVTVADPGAGNDITLTLDASRLDADNNYYPQVNFHVLFKNETVGWIRAINVTAGGLGGGVDQVQLVIRPLDNTKTCGQVVAGEELAISSNGFSEGSGMPNPENQGVDKYENVAQILKKAIGVTGTELVNETWIDQYNEAGEFQGYYRTGQDALDYRMLTAIDGMFWHGQLTDNTAGRAIDPTTNRPYKTSEGLITYLRRVGNVNPYTVGSYDVSEFDSYELTLEQNFVDPGIPVWMPMATKLYQEVENELVDYLDNTNVDYTRTAVNDMLFNSGDSKGVNINFKYLTKSGRTFLFDKLSGFSNPKTYGSSTYDYDKMGFIIPLEKRRDPKSQGDIPSIGIRYRAMGAYNRRMITDTLSGIGAAHGGRIPVNTIDASNTYQMAHMGNEFFGGNRMILIDPS